MNTREAIKRAFDEYFAGYRMSLPELSESAGEFEQNGWDVQYKFGVDYLECYATHRMTNDRLYRIYADGRVELVDSTTDGVLPDHDRNFSDEVRRRGFRG
ncbi:hypothetical protein [Acrocarpospora sp. B8E8]|uniref:hypothetical protein n=1 Tax=Acrocarpospora sp. B8E8 TaxID=3153572 RepID=UPI00325E815B